MSVRTPDDFFALLEKSGVLKEATLTQIRQKFADVHDVRQLARKLVNRKILTDWQARCLLSGRNRLKVGQYRLLDRFAKQAIGDRFLAVHEQLDRKVDVLILPKAASHNKKLFDKFLQQASLVAELDHDNLLHVYDIDKAGGRYFLVFEHDDGDSLRNVPAGSLDQRSIASITKQSLDGIAYAHDRNVLHGKLDESQIRVDQKGKVTVRNIGLAKLLDQLVDPNDETDEFAITPDPADDVVAVGRIARNLYKQHIGKPLTDTDKALYVLLGKVAGVTETSDGKTATLAREFDQWLQCHDQENAPLKRTAETAAALDPAAKTVAAAHPGQQPQTPDKQEFGKKLWLAIAAVVAVLAIGSGLWFMFSGSDDDRTADSQSVGQKDPVTNQDSNKGSTNSLDAAAGDYAKQKNEKGFRPNVTPEPVKQKKRNDARQKDNEHGKQNSEENVTDSTGDPSNAEPKWSSVNRPGDSSQTAHDEVLLASAEPPVAVVMPHAEGLPLVAWADAASHMDQELVVYGTIVDVGSSKSGKTRYLNFRKDDYSAFKIVLRERDVKMTEEDLREKFLDKHVCVRGEINTYRDNLQMLLLDLDRVLILDALPGPQTKLVGMSPSSVSSVATTGVIAGMAGGLPIPELTRETPDFDRHVLGPVKVGDDPLGIFLTVPAEACARPVFFEIQRDQSGRRWEILFAPKVKDAESSKQTVAEIHFENDQLLFNWVKTDNFDVNVNYLLNCLLEIKTPDESKTVLMRKPLKSNAIVLDEKRPSFSDRVSLKYLPIPESISVEFLPLPRAEFEVQYSDYSNTVNVNQPETIVYFDVLPAHQFFRLWHSAKISNHIKIESALQINAPNRALLFNKRNLKELEENLLRAQIQINDANASAVAYEPQRGEKTRHKERVKELSRQLEIVNAQVAAFHATKPVAQKIIGRELKYRVFFTVGDVQYDLVSPDVAEATTTGQ